MKKLLQFGGLILSAAIIASLFAAAPRVAPAYAFQNCASPIAGQVTKWTGSDWTCQNESTSSGGLPSGAIVLIDTGTCPAGTTEVAGLSGVTIEGTVAANADVGTTGGADNITPAGTVSQPTFTGSSVSTSSDSAGTPAGSVSVSSVNVNKSNPANQSVNTGAETFTGSAMSGHAHTLTAAGTVSQPTFTGTSFDNRSAFTRVIFCKAN